MQHTGQVTTASGLNVIAGLWLIISSFVVGFNGLHNLMWDTVIVGIIVAVLAAVRLWGPRRAFWVSWINVILGIWIIISPWIFSESGNTRVLWTCVISGIVIALLALWSALASETRPV